MPETNWLEQVVKNAVSEVLDDHLARIQNELVERVLREVEPRLGASSEGPPATLLKTVSSIQSGTTQREILRTLLDGAAHYAGRVALFVIKTGTATGWQARGFAPSDEIKDFNLEVGSGVAAQVLRSRTGSSGPADQMDGQFVAHFHPPADGIALLLPLVLKEKVAALVYADAGSDPGGRMDAAALELLVVTTGAWLEVVALRKQRAKESSTEASGHETAGHESAPQEKTAPAASFSDPFAPHAPTHLHVPEPPVEAAVAVAEEPAAVASRAAHAEAAPFRDAHGAAATAAAVAPDTLAGLSPEDADIHRKAQRFARLLVDEIKLYNQAKVSEGRKNRDLYDRLKEDIDKSFATYQKRYGNTVAASAAYFNGELVRSLAEDDISLLGANFQR